MPLDQSYTSPQGSTCQTLSPDLDLPPDLQYDRSNENRLDETTCLLPNKPRPKKVLSKRGKYFLFTCLLLSLPLLAPLLINFLYPVPVDKDPVHERLRREWETERQNHIAEQVRMEEERKVMADQRHKWELERKAHLVDQQQFDREREEMVRRRQEWDIEKDEMAREASEARERWDAERKGWKEERSRWNETRTREETEAREKRDLEREGWEEEKREWAEKVAKHEQKEIEWREKERKLERRRDVLHWGPVQPVDRCSEYGVRDYTATLVNRPMDYDGRLSCAANPIEINGVVYETPDYCEDVDQRGQEFVGHWTVHRDPSCVTYWEEFQDKGCVGLESGLRRYQARMNNLYDTDDWRIMCETTPVRLKGRAYEHPFACANWGRNGIWGIWMVEDKSC